MFGFVERRQRDRKLDSEARRREWNEKYGGRDGEFAIGSRNEESEDLKIRANASKFDLDNVCKILLTYMYDNF